MTLEFQPSWRPLLAVTPPTVARRHSRFRSLFFGPDDDVSDLDLYETSQTPWVTRGGHQRLMPRGSYPNDARVMQFESDTQLALLDQLLDEAAEDAAADCWVQRLTEENEEDEEHHVEETNNPDHGANHQNEEPAHEQEETPLTHTQEEPAPEQQDPSDSESSHVATPSGDEIPALQRRQVQSRPSTPPMKWFEHAPLELLVWRQGVHQMTQRRGGDELRRRLEMLVKCDECEEDESEEAEEEDERSVPPHD